jgi:signal transduction histidine kinase
MITFADFFEINHEIILFIYGLVFFILGFAIILQVRRSSRLDLARSLRWLAAFGITHAFNEWGDLFIPIQAEYLSAAVIQRLYYIQLVLLAVSFACLFEFGVAVLHPKRGARWLHALSCGLLAAWLVVSFLVLLPAMPDNHLWRHTAIALARYFIGFPGGLLAGYGLRMHTFQRIKPLNVPKIVRTLRVAGFSLGIYALLGGLIPPPVGFFPGNILNTLTFTQAVGAPPWVFRSIIGLVIAAAIIRALEIFEVETERRIEALEQQQIISAEHEKLARELHDGAIQKVYTAGLLVESAARLASAESEIGGRLQKAVIVLNDSIADLRRNLAELHDHAQAQTDPLPTLLGQLAQDPHYNSLVNISLALELSDAKSLSPARIRHVLAIVNEALANVIRHARAQNVMIAASDLGERLKVTVRDDGIGRPAAVRDGYGLRNMRDRAHILGGTIEFTNDKGTLVSLEIPWRE